jgi:hypothetical protein
MSTDLVIIPPTATFYIFGRLFSALPTKDIHSSSFRATNTAKSLNLLHFASPVLGRVAKYPKGAEYSESSKHPEGKPQLNRYFRRPRAFRGRRCRVLCSAQMEGGFDLDSFRVRTAVTLRNLSQICLSLNLSTLKIK